MNFPTHIDQVIHDHQQALHADARAHRLTRSARAGRRAQRRSATAALVPTLPSTRRRQCEVADLVSRLAAASDLFVSTPIDRRIADLLVAAPAVFEDSGGAVELEPLRRGTPAVVSLRWLARLAERTADQDIRLDAAPLAALANIVADVQTLAEGPPATPGSARSITPVRARRPLPGHLLGVR